MSFRNPSKQGGYGITPQTFGGPTADKFNREAGAAIGELQASLEPAAVPSDETPASAKRYGERLGGYGWPYATAAVSLSSGSPNTDVPSSGVGIGTVYKGERVLLEFHLDAVTASGAAFVNLDLLGKAGQGSAEQLVSRTQPFVQAVSNRVVFTGTIFEVKRQIFDARLRMQLGSAGGTIAIPINASMLQRWAVLAPVESS